MKKSQDNKWMAIVYGVFCLAIGVLLFTFSIINIDVVDSIISISLAVGLFIIGLMYIIIALVAHTNDFFTGSLVLGSVFIAVGVVLCVNTALIGSFIVYLVGALLCAIGAVCLIKAIVFIAFKQKVSWIVIYFIMMAVTITAGILILVFQGQSRVALYCTIGSLIGLTGILEIILGIKLLLAEPKKETKEDKKLIIEAETETAE